MTFLNSYHDDFLHLLRLQRGKYILLDAYVCVRMYVLCVCMHVYGSINVCVCYLYVQYKCETWYKDIWTHVDVLPSKNQVPLKLNYVY